MLSTLLAIILVLTSLFLILLVLIQRGRGGGLAGAFGGMGGQSAFGAKAGDLFTRVTIGVAAFWIVLCIVSLKAMGSKENKFTAPGSGATQESLPPGADDKSATTDGKSTTGEKSASGDAAKSSDGADKGASADGEKTSSGPSLGTAPPAGEKNSEKSEAPK